MEKVGWLASVRQCVFSRSFFLPDASYHEQLYRFAFSEVGPYWIELGLVLDFSYTELKSLEQDYRTLKKDPKHMALEMLQRYSQRMGIQRKPIKQPHQTLEEVKSQRKQEIGDAHEPSGQYTDFFLSRWVWVLHCCLPL